MASGFIIDGAKELERKLQTLPVKVQQNIVRQAVRAAQNVGVKAARARARALPTSKKYAGAMRALLAKNIIIKVPKKKKRGEYSMHVQMRPGVNEFVYYRRGSQTAVSYSKGGGRKIGKETGRTYIPAAIEYGHGSTPELAARPFMRPAIWLTTRQRIEVLSRMLASGILREAIKGRLA